MHIFFTMLGSAVLALFCIGLLTMLDLAKISQNDKTIGLIEENLTSAPEFAVLPMRTIRGTTYQTALRIGFPAVGFRQANGQTTPGQSTFEQKLVQCFILSSIVQVDKAIALAYEDGEDALKTIEALGVFKQALIQIGKQIWYGTQTLLGGVGDVNGFPGLLQIAPAGLTLDAGGTTDAQLSSAYFLRRGPQDVTLVAGNGMLPELSPWRVETLSNVASFIADLTGWIGMQCVNPNSVGRIKKLSEAEATKGMTDLLAAKLIALFPVGNKPDLCAMSRRSQRQLQVSRSVTIMSSGNEKAHAQSFEIMAPPPESVFGVPIVVTDSIVDVEQLTL